MNEEKRSKRKSAEQTAQGENEGKGIDTRGEDYVSRYRKRYVPGITPSEHEAIQISKRLAARIMPHQTRRLLSHHQNFIFLSFDVSFDLTNTNPLTPTYLESTIMPFIKAIEDLQHIINEVKGEQETEVLVRDIQQHSPVSVSMDGAAEAMQLVQETVVPWRRKHAEIMAQLAEREKLVEIEARKAEVLASRANTEKTKVEAEKQRQEVEKMKLENEKLRLALAREKIQLALEMLAVIRPEMNDVEKIQYAMELLRPLEVLTQSPLEIASMITRPE